MLRVLCMLYIAVNYAKLQAYGFVDLCAESNSHECPDPNIKFLLFTKNNRDIPEIITIGLNISESNLDRTSYDSSKPIKIIIHGFSETEDSAPLLAIRNEYLSTRDYNIFTIDWTELINSRIVPCYLDASWTVRHVGKCSSQLIQRLRQTGVTDIHVIGFSLGAQVLNSIATNLRPYSLPRLTGLDPALPLFISPNRDDKLDSSDADFVDVYHTDAFVYGQVVRNGDVDVYMNGGVIQPGCENSNNTFSCNHNRAPLYFAESINSKKGFWGWSCPWYWSYLPSLCPSHQPLVLVGDMINKTIRGMYYVKTSSTPPFALGIYNISV